MPPRMQRLRQAKQPREQRSGQIPSGQERLGQERLGQEPPLQETLGQRTVDSNHLPARHEKIKQRVYSPQTKSPKQASKSKDQSIHSSGKLGPTLNLTGQPSLKSGYRTPLSSEETSSTPTPTQSVDPLSEAAPQESLRSGKAQPGW